MLLGRFAVCTTSGYQRCARSLYTSEKLMESLRNKIHVCLVERTPNALTFANLLGQISGTDAHTLEKELQSMSADGLVVIRPGKRYPDYALPSYDGLPVREYVAVGDIKVPRLLSDERARPEELNIFVEVLARRMIQIELEAEKNLDERLKSYWANVVTLFGAFIGVFSLIVGFLKTVPLEANSTFWSVLILSSAQVLPLAIMLGAFVWLLRALFK